MSPNEDHAKIAEFFENALQSVQELYSKPIHGQRNNFLKLLIPAIICAKSVQYQAIAAEIEGDVQEASKIRRIHNFLSSYELDYEFVALFLIFMLPRKGKVRLCLDRTEWSFGNCTHNILTVTAYTHGVGIPIWFECVAPNGGCSDEDDKIYMLMKCVELLGKTRIKCVIGDSEFIGEKWISYLHSEGIIFYIDIRSNQYFDYKGQRWTVTQWMRGRYKSELCGMKIYGLLLNLGIKRQKLSKNAKKKAFLAIITNELTTNGVLSVYQNRWSIEVFFQSIKGRGFNLEGTHIQDPLKIRRLFAVLCMAFILSFLIGLQVDKVRPIPIKKHGYKTNSFFRAGCDFIRQAIHKRSIILQGAKIFTTINAFFVTFIQTNIAFFQANTLVKKSFVQ